MNIRKKGFPPESPKPLPDAPLRSLFLTLFLGLLLIVPAAFAQDDEEEAPFNQAELDQMLAPIALYPDALLSQILVATTYPLEVVEAARWSRNNRNLDGQKAVEAVEDKNWDPSVKSLVAVPQILAYMSEDLEWTQRLGDAFLIQEEQVMDTVQSLRHKAYEAGKLDSVDNIRVHREREVIVIEPANPRVVYVPYYSSRVVYGHWWWPEYPPVYWGPPRGYYSSVGIVWSRPYVVSSGFYFCTFHWPRRQVVVIHNHHHHHHRTVTRGRYNFSRYDSYPRWRHNPTHRRGVAYRDARLNQRYSRSSASGTVSRSMPEARRNWQNHYASRYQRERGGRPVRDGSRFSSSTEERAPSRGAIRTHDRDRADRSWSRDREDRSRFDRDAGRSERWRNRSVDTERDSATFSDTPRAIVGPDRRVQAGVRGTSRAQRPSTADSSETPTPRSVRRDSGSRASDANRGPTRRGEQSFESRRNEFVGTQRPDPRNRPVERSVTVPSPGNPAVAGRERRVQQADRGQPRIQASPRGTPGERPAPRTFRRNTGTGGSDAQRARRRSNRSEAGARTPSSGGDSRSLGDVSPETPNVEPPRNTRRTGGSRAEPSPNRGPRENSERSGRSSRSNRRR